MDLGLKGRTAVVTGGTSGVGLATVRALLDEGCQVAFCGRDAGRLAEAEAQLRKQFPDAPLIAFPCDVLDAAQVESFALTVTEAFGACDVLINNAGTSRVSTFSDTSDEAWIEENRLKLFGVIYPTRAFRSLLEVSAAAAIVNVNSLLSLQPEPHLVATSAARAGLLNLTKSMAVELAPHGIRVNSVLLGTIESGQWQRRFEKQGKPGESYEDYLKRLATEKRIPLGRFGEPAEVANAMVFLASSAAAYTTGASIDVSGGIARHIG
jgi:NAD(P)-dependent dehydrogenase (short-subunit alcohol dehydrogenase family)